MSDIVAYKHLRQDEIEPSLRFIKRFLLIFFVRLTTWKRGFHQKVEVVIVFLYMVSMMYSSQAIAGYWKYMQKLKIIKD